MSDFNWVSLSNDVWVKTIQSSIYKDDGFLTWRIARHLDDEGFIVYNIYKCSEESSICVASGCETFDDADDVVNELEQDVGEFPLGWISFFIVLIVIGVIFVVKGCTS